MTSEKDSSRLRTVIPPPATQEEARTGSLRTFLEEMADRYGDQTFLRALKDRKIATLTFRELQKEAVDLQGGLREIGIRPGSRVALVGENSIEWIVIFFAITILGGIIVPIDPRLPVEELSCLLADCEPSAAFGSRNALEKLEKAAASLRFSNKIYSLEDGPDDWKRLRGRTQTTVEARLRPNDTAALLYTSGTTGNPKGVMLTHGNLLHAARILAGFVPTRHEDRILFVLPLFHIYCLSTFLVAFAAGSRVTFQNSLRGPDLLEALNGDSCTMMVAVPRLLDMLCRGLIDQVAQKSLLQRLVFKGLSAASPLVSSLLGNRAVRKLFRPIQDRFGGHLTYFISGGGKLDGENGTFLKNLGFVVQEGYGLTETTGAVAVNRHDRARIGTVGEVIPGTEIKIAEPCAQGIGEVVVRGPTVFKGYYRRDDLTAEVLSDGWFKTGDLGVIDRSGYLTLTGRKKDVIVLKSGKNVYPDEVEALYSQSALIKQIGVIGADIGRGEEVCAFIVPSETGDPEAIEARLKDELARLSQTVSPHKRITHFRMSTEDLPQTQIGKIKRHELRKRLEEKPKEQNNITGEIDDLTANVIALLKRCLSGRVPAAIGSESHLELDLGMDSLARTELVTAMEKAFRISVPDHEILNVQTVGDITALLSRYTAGEISDATKAAFSEEFSIHPAIPDRLDATALGQHSRLDWIQKLSGAELKHLPHTTLDPSVLKGNIEHFIGMAQVPVGLAGPILIDGEAAQGAVYVPMATTEGALVASVTRGMMAITYSGGARARVLDDQVMRAPTWIFERGRQAEIFVDWLRTNFSRIKAVAESTTRSGRLIDLEYIPNGRRVTVRFLYTSGDASGQNMVTMATHAACTFINREQPVRGLVQHFLENNLSGDKKMSMVNILSARGKKVYADAVIKKDILHHFLHTTPQNFVEFSKEGALGSMQAGIYGTNAQYANVLAAIFMATGQDVACTHEAATGLTVADLTPEGDLYISVTLPNVIVATVGGGTGKGTQRECLDIMGCAGSGKVNRLAEIIAASVLAGEISIAGAHAAGDFAQAHDKLGRNRPPEGAKIS